MRQEEINAIYFARIRMAVTCALDLIAEVFDELDSVGEFTEQFVEALHDKFGWTEEYAAGQMRVTAEVIEQNTEAWIATRRRDKECRHETAASSEETGS